MKPSNSLRSTSRVLAALGLTALVFSVSQCGVGGGLPEPDGGTPVATCGPHREPTCSASNECDDLALKPICSQETASCESGLCSYQPISGPGCPCMEFTTKPCTLANGSPGQQTCGRLTDETTDWCECMTP